MCWLCDMRSRQIEAGAVLESTQTGPSHAVATEAGDDAHAASDRGASALTASIASPVDDPDPTVPPTSGAA